VVPTTRASSSLPSSRARCWAAATAASSSGPKGPFLKIAWTHLGLGSSGKGLFATTWAQLRAGENHDPGPHAQVHGDGPLERRGDPRGVGLLAGEAHVAALNVGRHLGVAHAKHNLAQRRHGDRVAAADVDPAQQGDMGRHAVIVPSLDGLASRWHR
jgi:hypothetical protein